MSHSDPDETIGIHCKFILFFWARKIRNALSNRKLWKSSLCLTLPVWQTETVLLRSKENYSFFCYNPFPRHCISPPLLIWVLESKICLNRVWERNEPWFSIPNVYYARLVHAKSSPVPRLFGRYSSSFCCKWEKKTNLFLSKFMKIVVFSRLLSLLLPSIPFHKHCLAECRG